MEQTTEINNIIILKLRLHPGYNLIDSTALFKLLEYEQREEIEWIKGMFLFFLLLYIFLEDDILALINGCWV